MTGIGTLGSNSVNTKGGHAPPCFQETAADPKALSVVTYGELLYGALKSQGRQENLAKVRRLWEIFPIVEATNAIMETYAAIKADIESRGKPLDDFDLVIAATAISLGYRLVTNNERHFRRIEELQLENWTRRDSHPIRPDAVQ